MLLEEGFGMDNGRYQLVGLCALAAGLAACTASSAGTPGFAAPDEAQARQAYLAAVRADFLGSNAESYLKDVPERFRSTHQAMQDPNEREVVQRILRSITKVKVIGCQWSPLDERAIESRSRPRTEGKFTAGYLCDLSVHLTSQERGALSAPARGFFYQDGGGLVFAGEYAHGWEPDADASGQASTQTGGSWGGSEAAPPP
jgi:hypothetical protein